MLVEVSCQIPIYLFSSIFLCKSNGSPCITMQDHLLQRRMLRHSPWMLWSFQPQSLLQPVLLPLMTSQPKGENIKYQLKPVGSKTEIMGEHGSPASASTRAPTTTGTPSTESSSPAPTIPTLLVRPPLPRKRPGRGNRRLPCRMTNRWIPCQCLWSLALKFPKLSRRPCIAE